MTRVFRLRIVSLLALSTALLAAGCHKNQDQNAANASNQASTQEPASDPASANLVTVPASTTTTSQSAPATQTAASSESAPATDTTATQPDQIAGSDLEEADYEPPAQTATQAPPPLPDYDQPPDPGDDDIWTPGYWAWGSGGYYWVPGAWVQPPYTGALWTPGYWAYHNNRYAYYRGYWGHHIGFYGGVNYGYGYVGYGYQGGYWKGNSFYYNRTVNNVNANVHNVYDYHINARNNARVSFNGGPGGITVRPRPSEVAAWREPHAAPIQAQLQTEHAASQDRAQFYNTNHGRPAEVVARQPLAAQRGEHIEETRPIQTAPAMQHRQQPGQPQMQPQHQTQQQHPAAPQHQVAPRHPAPAEQHGTPQRREATPAPQQRGAAPQRPAAPQHPVQHTEPGRAPAAPQHHEAAPQHSAPAPHQAAPQHPAPAQHPAAPQHAAPQQHAAANHAQPQHRPEDDQHPHR